MTTYTIRTQTNEYSQHEVSRYLIEDIISHFEEGVWDFLVLDPSDLVQGSTFIQVGAPQEIVDYQYTVEMVFKTGEKSSKMYRLLTHDENLVCQYLADYLEKQQVPDVSKWEDITHEGLVQEV